MTNKKVSKRVLSTLSCASTNSDEYHFCEDPIALVCGHYICKCCFPTVTNSYQAKCNICKEINTIDANQDEMRQSFTFLLSQNLNQLFNNLHKTFKKTFKKCKATVCNHEERIDAQIENVKYDVQIRIESLKNELDNMYDLFIEQLDDIKQQWKSDTKNIESFLIDQNAYKRELQKLEEDIHKRENLTEENLYTCQNEIKKLRNIINQYNETAPKLSFKATEETLDKEIIGKIVFERKLGRDKHIITQLKDNKYEKFDVGFKPWDSCELPNGNIVLIDYVTKCMQLYNRNMELIKTILEISDRKMDIISMTSDGVSSLFFCDFKHSCVIKTDLGFNLLALFGNGVGSESSQLNCPSGLCYYNHSVYVCDNRNKRIQRLDSNLTFQESLSLHYEPQYIKNIDNVAIVRPFHDLTIYFYDLNNLGLLRSYDGHRGFIGVSLSNFYEFYQLSKTFYVYSNSGELIEEIPTCGFELNKYNDWGSICVLREKLYLSNYGTDFIVVIS